MIKKINLQMFAEGDGAQTTVDTSITDTTTATKADGTPAEGEKKYSDADVNALIDRKFAEWQKKQDKAVEAAKEKEAAKLAQMCNSEWA